MGSDQEDSQSIKKNNVQKKQDPLHGITLEMILNELISDLGWEQMGAYIKIKCFNDNPSLKSSLTFLRRTEWARKKVERLYLWNKRQKNKKTRIKS